jgi:hypothetical protein
MIIGIDRDHNLFYEGRGNWGHAVWPSPVVTPARIVFEKEGDLKAENRRDLVGDAWIFREDSFDPTARLRRGRFYQAGNQQPVQWHVQVHPAIPSEAREANKGMVTKLLETFHGYPVWYRFFKDQNEQPLVLLGFEERFTIWRIIDVEYISTGEDLVTLKACSSLGVLPQVNVDVIPERNRNAVMEFLEIFTDEVHRSAPISVIDRARDAASQVLLAYTGLEGGNAKDLGGLVGELEKEEEPKLIAINASRIIARLHARAKPVEKAKRPLRDIREQDAELAAQCLGVILCELGWAGWR